MIHLTFPDARAPRIGSPRVLTALFCVLLAPAILSPAQSPALTAPALSPQPKEIHAQQLIPIHVATILVPGGDPEDLFAAQNLNQDLTQRGILIAPAAGTVDLTVKLLRAGSSQALQLLSANHLSFDTPMHDEGYILLSQKNPTGGDAVDIIGQTSVGVFYGVQTLKQLVEATATSPQIWTATIR